MPLTRSRAVCRSSKNNSVYRIAMYAAIASPVTVSAFVSSIGEVSTTVDIADS